jgi:hypothetical protein
MLRAASEAGCNPRHMVSLAEGVQPSRLQVLHVNSCKLNSVQKQFTNPPSALASSAMGERTMAHIWTLLQF